MFGWERFLREPELAKLAYGEFLKPVDPNGTAMRRLRASTDALTWLAGKIREAHDKRTY